MLWPGGAQGQPGPGPVLYTPWEGGAVQGVVTRDVADTAAVLDVICGPDVGQWYNAPPPERPFLAEVGADPGRLRIGLVEQAPFGLPVDAVCAEAAAAAAHALEQLGHQVQRTSFEVPDEFVDAFFKVANSGLADYEGVNWDRVEPHIKANRASALSVDSLTYVASVHLLQRLSGRL